MMFFFMTKELLKRLQTQPEPTTMSLMKLTIEELLAISEDWLVHQRDDFLSLPEIAGLLPLVERAHNELASLRSQNDGENPEYVEAAKLADSTDDRHDATVRAVWDRLGSQEQYYMSLDPPDIGSARAIYRVREKLLPEGLALIDLPYWKEAVFAAELEQRIDATTREILGRIPMATNTSLLDVVKHWGKLGRSLGHLESAKVASVMKQRKHVRSTRILWLEITETVFTVLHQVHSNIDAATRLRNPYIEGLALAQERDAPPVEL